MKTKFYFLFLFSLFMLFSVSASTYNKPIYDVVMNTSQHYIVTNYEHFLNSDDDSSYIEFLNPINGTLTRIYSSDVDVNNGAWFVYPGKFTLYVGGNDGDRQTFLINASSSTSQIWKHKFTLHASSLPFSSEASESFYVSIVPDSMPYQVSTPNVLSLSSAPGSTRSFLISDIWALDSFSNVTVYNNYGQSITMSRGGVATCVNNATANFRFCLAPLSSVNGEDDISFSITSLSSNSVGKGYFNFNVQQLSDVYWDKNRAGSDVYPSGSWVSYSIYYDIYSSSNITSDIPGSSGGYQESTSSQSGFFGTFSNTWNGFFPDSSSMSSKQKISYVVVAMFVLAFICIAGLLSGRVQIGKGVFFLVGVLEILLLFYFITIGYIGVGLLIVLVIVALALIFLGRR